MKLTDYTKTRNFHHALYVGESGSGKSVAAATVGGWEATHFIHDFDWRIEGILGCSLVNQEKVEFEQYLFSETGIAAYNNKVDSLRLARRSGVGLPDVLHLESAGAFTQSLLKTAREIVKGGEKVKVGGKDVYFTGPKDYGFEVTMMNEFVGEMRTMPCHCVVSCHIIEKWGKPPGKPYESNVVVGEKLNLRDNIGASMAGSFTNVFKFSREMFQQGQKMSLRYFVSFNDADLAKNGDGIPPGLHDITNVKFWEYYQTLLKGDVKRPSHEVRKEMGL